MRLSVFLIGCFCATALFASGDQSKIDGKVRAVSADDVRAITTAAKQWLHQTPDLAKRGGDNPSLIHVVDHNKAEAHFGAQDRKSQGYFVETVITVRRIKGVWKADDIAKVTGSERF
jgi:hypothetical protein